MEAMIITRGHAHRTAFRGIRRTVHGALERALREAHGKALRTGGLLSRWIQVGKMIPAWVSGLDPFACWNIGMFTCCLSLGGIGDSHDS